MNPSEKGIQGAVVKGAIVPYTRRTYLGKHSEKAKRYHESQKAMAWQLKQQLQPIGSAPFRLGCTFWISKRVGVKDFDNLEKAVLDCLKYAGIIKNDCQMVGHVIGYVDGKIKDELDRAEIVLQVVADVRDNMHLLGLEVEVR